MRWEEAQAVVGEPCPACGQPGEIDWKETTTLRDPEPQYIQGATICRTESCPRVGRWVHIGEAEARYALRAHERRLAERAREEVAHDGWLARRLAAILGVRR